MAIIILAPAEDFNIFLDEGRKMGATKYKMCYIMLSDFILFSNNICISFRDCQSDHIHD
jgi:hypothetical protein